MSQLDQTLPKSDLENPLERVTRATEFFRHYESHIRGIIDFVVSDQHCAEDLYQEFYLALVKKPLPDDIVDVEGYLFKTLLNKAREQRRKTIRYQKMLERYADRREPESQQGDIPEKVSQQDEVETVMRQAKRILGQREYEVIHMRYCEGQGRQDVGKRLGLKANTISRYIWAGIEKIRRIPALNERERL